MAVGSIAINGLLGGTAGKIDTDALISALMAAKSMPKQQLQLQVAQQATVTQAYQSINSTMTAVGNAASNLADTTSWQATQASSSSSDVVASSTATAATGSTTFKVTALAQAQISTVKATGNDWVTDYTQGIDITSGKDDDGNDIVHHIDLASGSVDDIASAINNTKDLGVRAAVINTDSGKVLQLTSTKTGLANGFSVAGMTSGAQELQGAQDAQVTVGSGPSGYSISSATNTFVDAMPGVTFTLGANSKDQNVTISVASDTAKIASLVNSLTNSVNSARLAIDNYTAKGGPLLGDSTVNSLTQDMSSVFTSATASGKSLTDYGIDISKDGLLSFDSDTFTAAYNADPEGTMQALSDAIATPLKNISDASSAPTTGTISALITSGNDRTTDLNTRIDAMQTRLDQVQDQLQTKYVAMQTALAKLQSQGDWLTSMFKSMQSSSDSSSS